MTTGNTEDAFISAAPRREVKRDSYGRYRLPRLSGGTDTSWTRATTFARSIADTFALNAWQQRMVVKGLSNRPDLYALAASTPVSDSKTLTTIVENAKEAAEASKGARLGTALHGFLEAVNRGETPSVPAPWDKDIAACTRTLESAGLRVLPGYSERIVVVERYGVAGTFDAIVESSHDELFCADWKSGRDLSFSWPEIAVQLALYAHGDGVWNPDTRTYTPMPDVSKTTALVAHLPAGTGTCTLYEVDITRGWEAAKLCQQVRSWRTTKGLAAPFRVEQEPVTGLPDPVTGPDLHEPEGEESGRGIRDDGWADMVASATSKAELSKLWRAGTAQGWWTPVLTTLGKERLAELGS